MTTKMISGTTTATAAAAGIRMSAFQGMPGINTLSSRSAFEVDRFKEHAVITIPMNALPVRAIFRRLELPFDRARLYDGVADVVYRDPEATLLGPELQERLVSEVTDDMTSVLQTAAATGADISPYYSALSEQFTPKAQRMIAQLLHNKLAGREGRAKRAEETGAGQQDYGMSSPRRKVLRRVTDQLRTHIPELFEGRTRGEVRNLISAVLVWQAPAIDLPIFHSGRLTDAGIRYFKSIQF